MSRDDEPVQIEHLEIYYFNFNKSNTNIVY